MRVQRRGSGGAGAPSSIYHACRGLETEVLLLATVFTRRKHVRDAVIRYLAKLRGSRLDIRGSDLVAAGVAEGPAVSRGLEAALDAMLDRGGLSRSEQLRLALEAARKA